MITNTTASIDLAQLDKLEALARAATPGPWQTERGTIKAIGDFDRICTMQVSNQQNWNHDAEFIAAANPATMLTLIAAARGSLQSTSSVKTDHSECEMCNGSGIVGFRPDQYEDCPDCAAARLGTSEQQARYAIDGAIQYGRESRNPPPSTDHWLYEYWNIGQQLRELGKTGWDNVTLIPSITAGAGSAQPLSTSVEFLSRASGEKREQPRAEGDERAPCAKCGKPRSEHIGSFSMMCPGTTAEACGQIFEPATAALDQGAQAATKASASIDDELRDLLETLLRPYGIFDVAIVNAHVDNQHDFFSLKDRVRAALARAPLPAQVGARIPTEAMLNAARDWSVKKYGIGVGNDAATGCWQAMYDAAPAQPVDDARDAAAANAGGLSPATHPCARKVYTPQFALAVHAALAEIGSDMDLHDAAQMLWTQTNASMDRDTLVQALRSGAAMRANDSAAEGGK